jgi:ATP-dependent DNA helicase RecQ
MPAPKSPPVAVAGQPARNKRDESWRHLIDEAEVPLFNTLRDWRLARCKRDGVPPYVICNNQQLAAIVKARPQSLAALGQIEGFGEAKMRSYGAEILALMAHPAPEPPPANSEARPEPAGGEQ